MMGAESTEAETIPTLLHKILREVRDKGMQSW